MKLLITGGAGFLGINLVRYLHSRVHEVVSLDIVDFDYPDMKDKIKIINGDIRDKSTVANAMAGIDIVIHTAAALPLYKPEDIISTDVGGTRNLIYLISQFFKTCRQAGRFTTLIVFQHFCHATPASA